MNITPDQARHIVETAIRNGWATRPASFVSNTELMAIKRAQMRRLVRCKHCRRVMREDSQSWKEACAFSSGGHEPERNRLP